MGFVKYETKGQVGIITIDRPKALNALNSQVLDDLKEVLDGVDQQEIRCLIVTGSGDKSFVAGADIAAMSTMSQAEAEAFGKKGNDIFRALEVFPIPSIAAVNGFALGGGCELAMACDIRICSENAKFGQPEVGLGIIPGFSGTVRLARLVGMGIAKQLIYTGKPIKADEALRIGLVNAVVPQAELMDKALELANQIAANAPLAVRAAKQCINAEYDMPVDDAIVNESSAFGNCFATEDQKNGMKAFLNKEKYVFQGK
jgi:enoyl-CoA hydratase